MKKWIQSFAAMLLLTINMVDAHAMSSRPAILWNGSEYNQNSQLQLGWADEFFLKHYAFVGTEHILDIGAGDGKITARIAKLVPKGTVLGIDSSESMLNKANKAFRKTSNLHFIVEDAQNTAFYHKHANEFDLVVSFSTLHWVKDQSAALKGIHTVLKPNGKCYLKLCSKSYDPIQEIADKLITTAEYRQYFTHFVDPVTRFNESEYNALLEGAHLKRLSIKDTEEKDKLENRAKLSKQLKSWLPHYHFLKGQSPMLAEKFMNNIIDQYLSQHPADQDGSITLYDHYLEVVAQK